MATSKAESKLSYDIMDKNPNETIFDQNLNNYLALRNVSWNGNGPKLEIRKWFINSKEEEIPGKGITFLTSNGPDQLTHLLLKLGYGDNNTINEIMKERAKNALNNSSSIKEEVDDNIKKNLSKEMSNTKPSKFNAKNLLENISVK